MSGGVYYEVSCDPGGVHAEPGVRYQSREDALHARQRVARFDGWLLKRPRGKPAVLLCPECVAAGK